MKKTALFLFSLLIVTGFSVISLSGAGVSGGNGDICADTYYGIRQCETIEPQFCPFNSDRVNTNSLGQTFCVETGANRFCEIMTGNPNVKTSTGSADSSANFLYCERAESRVGYCDSSTSPSSFRWSIPDTNLERREIEDVADKVIRISSLNIVNRVERGKLQIECNRVRNLNIIDEDDLHVVVPRVTGADYYNVYNDILNDTLESMSNIGFVIERGTNLGKPSNQIMFCPSNEYVYVNDGTSESCVKITQNQAPCNANLTGTSQCIKKRLRHSGQMLYNVTNININRSPNGSNINDPRSPAFEDAPSGSDLCKLSARDLFQRSSFKGCSEYTSLNSNTNQLTALDGYEDCLKCLYDSTRIDVDPQDAARTDPKYSNLIEGIRSSVPAGGGIVTIPSQGNPITPDIEPFGSQTPGAILNELGCIDTSDSSSIINTFIRLAIGLMGGIVVFRIIQGALTMQAGDPESFEEGRDVIISALIGLLLLIFSAAVLNYVGIDLLGLGRDSRNTPGSGLDRID